MAATAVSTEESWLTTDDGHKLFTKTWKPATLPPKAIVLFIHGFSDHVNRFELLFGTFARKGIQVVAFDQRGWGRSVSKKSERGLTGPTKRVMADITFMLTTHPGCLQQSDREGVPLFLMGHSMGGQETLYFASNKTADPVAIDAKRKVRGFIGLAPYLRLSPESQPSSALVMAGKVAVKLLPKFQMVQKLHPDNLCRDPALGKDWEADPLCHDTGTLEGMNGMIDRGEELAAGVAVIEDRNAPPMSVHIAHGSQDKITSCTTSQEFYQALNVKDKSMKVYEGYYHVLHAEPDPDKTTYVNELADWVLAHAHSASAASAASGSGVQADGNPSVASAGAAGAAVNVDSKL